MTTARAALGCIAVGALLTACSTTRRITLPETRIHVIDESGVPVAGIPVWYGVVSEIYRAGILGVFPRTEGYIGTRFILKQSMVTPANGELVLPPRVLQLGKNEYFHSEHIYANATVDSTSPVARTAGAIMENLCRQNDPLCPADGRVEPIDIAKHVWLSPEGRAQSLQPADTRYSVVRVLIVEPERQKDLEHRETEPVFVSRAFGSFRSRPETIRIELPGR